YQGVRRESAFLSIGAVRRQPVDRCNLPASFAMEIVASRRFTPHLRGNEAERRRSQGERDEEERFMTGPASVPAPDQALLEDLVTGNHILFHQGVVDAFGHLSVRHDKDPNKYLMSRHLAPGLVTAEDILAFDFDSNPVRDIGKRYYSERFIHGEIYRA